ncbi:MAG: DUF308 domain-containing protein [Firmicutes bacterium]|nr:DUF308 domain-containing protein [Bacillota bacterium]
MKKIKNSAGNLILSICEILLGIVLLVNPVDFIGGIIVIVGVVFAVMGLFNIIGYFLTPVKEATVGTKLTEGIIGLAVGIFCICNSGWVTATLSVIAVIYGIIVLLTGVVKVQWSIDLLRLKQKRWIFALISAVLSIIAGVIIVCNPFTTVSVAGIFAGVILTVEGILDIIAVFFGKSDDNIYAEYGKK